MFSYLAWSIERRNQPHRVHSRKFFFTLLGGRPFLAGSFRRTLASAVKSVALPRKGSFPSPCTPGRVQTVNSIDSSTHNNSHGISPASRPPATKQFLGGITQNGAQE